VVGLGLTRNAPYYPIDEFVERALLTIPDLRLRLPRQNSALVAAAVREGELEAALVILPVDPDGLEVRPLFSDEVLFVSADPLRTRRRIRIEDLAAARLILYDTTAGFNDPTRRQLAARAQAAGVPLIPRVEVEHPETAFQLAAKGLGNTIAARAVTRSLAFPAGLSTVGFAEPLFDSFALITRPGAVPPVVQAITHVLEEWPRSSQISSTRSRSHFRAAVRAQVLPAGIRHPDEQTAARRPIARDETQVIGLLPHREPRTRRPPCVEDLAVRAGVGAEPLQELEHQVVDGVVHLRSEHRTCET
jgi:hypothetical protein